MNANELANLTVDWLRETYPGSVIVTELSVADWGAASIDVAAITETHIVGVEIKGEGDSPARLDRQGLAYGMAAREMWLLCDESIQAKCFARRPPGWGRLEVWEGRVRPLNLATKPGGWVERPGGGRYLSSVRDDGRYLPDKPRDQKHQAPAVLCGALWRDELYEIARLHNLSTGGRAAKVDILTEAICNGLPVPIIHDEMVAALRRRTWKKQVTDTRQASTTSSPSRISS